MLKTITQSVWTKRALFFVIVCAPLYALWQILSVPEMNDDFLFAPATVGDIEKSIVATGQLEPKRYVEVGAQVSGQVENIRVEEGDVVKQGDLLVEIDATVFETQVQKTEADLENKKAQLAQLKAERELSIIRAKRNEELYAQDAVSADDVYSSKTELKVLDSKISASIAQIKADEASLAGDRATLGFAKIYAPIDGTVASIDVREGQTLNANQNAPTLLQISDLQTMTIRAEVSEADVSKIEKGMPVYFATLGDMNTHYYSEVRQVLPTPEVVNDVVLYQVLIDIENTTGKLMDSMTTQVFFVQDKRENTIVVPLAAVKGRGNMTFVLVQEGEQVVRRPVQTGVKNRTMVEITQGLVAGEQVVIGRRSETKATTTTRSQQMGPPDGMPPPGGDGPRGRRGGF